MNKEGQTYGGPDVLHMTVAQRIKMMIIERKMKPGDRLPTEKEMGELFKVSRSTLREAMKVLKAENVVVIRQGSGTYVSEGTGIAEDPLGLNFTNQENLLKNLFETRMLIEPQIAALAVQRATSQDLRKLERLLREMDLNRTNSTVSAELDVQFHTAIAECTHNDVLIRVVPIINESIRRSHVETLDDEESFQKGKICHYGIYRAIANGNYMNAKFLSEQHIWDTLSAMREKGRLK